MIRTTVKLEDNIFKQARKLAIDQGVPFANLVNEILANYVKINKSDKKTEFKLKVYKMGKVQDLARTKIYQDV